jgi:hypothetical protein
MTALSAAIDIDWGKLAEAALWSAIVALGVMLIGGLAVVASLRGQDRKAGGQTGVVAYDAVTIACVIVIAAAIVFGIYIMTRT